MDEITIEILEDGTIKTSTDKVSMANHQNAEAFLRDVAKAAGGEVTKRAKSGHAMHKHHAEDKFHSH